MKKIVHVITGLNDGGAEAVLYRLCITDKSCHHVVISLMGAGKYGSLLKGAGIELYCLNMRQGRISLSSLWRLFLILLQEKPRVVQTWMYHADLIGGVIARLAGVKNIFWGVHHTTLVKGESKRSTILVAKLNAFLSRFVPEKIIYCAERSRELQESLGFKQSKGVVVPNGYNTNDFQPSEEARSRFRESLGVEDDVFLIGHVGRFSPYKDYPSLLKAFSALSVPGDNVKIVLVGTGLDWDNKNLLDLIPVGVDDSQVLLLGRKNDIPCVMNGLDLFVLSSVSEAFPNVLNEAMACGTPCVTTDVGDAAFIVGGTGWVVPPRESQALASAIMQALDEKESNNWAWLQRKKDCRERVVEYFSIEKMVGSYRRVWFG